MHGCVHNAQGTGHCLIERQWLLVRAVISGVIACLPLYLCPQLEEICSAGCKFKIVEHILNKNSLVEILLSYQAWLSLCL